jgi:hypothetical protein
MANRRSTLDLKREEKMADFGGCGTEQNAVPPTKIDGDKMGIWKLIPLIPNLLNECTEREWNM